MQITCLEMAKNFQNAIVIFDLYRQFYNNPTDLKLAEDFLKDRLKSRDSLFLLAQESESSVVAGFIQVYPIWSSISANRTWLLNDLYVTEDFRRDGVAKQLLDEVKNQAKLADIKMIRISTEHTNESAKRLYERYGFEPDNRFKHYSLAIQ
jgi:ribosomal protein S18 acetylase RimI-like enzyme